MTNNKQIDKIEGIKNALRDIRSRFKTDYPFIKSVLDTHFCPNLKDGIRSLDERQIKESVTTCKRKPKHNDEELNKAIHNPNIKIDREPKNKIVHSYKLYDCSLQKKRG